MSISEKEIGRIREIVAADDRVKNSVVRLEDDGSKVGIYVLPKNQEDSYQIRKEKAKAKGWAMVYDISYSKTDEHTDPEFNTDLWISNYTGEAIPEEHMREWVDTTVSRILSLSDKSSPDILEIGCGSGLLLYPLLPHISRYIGVDNAEEGLKLITKQCKGREHGDKVSLYVADALSVLDLDLGSFDIIVINSVTQYFPSVEYLIAVIEGCMELLSPGGTLFLGDIRSYDMAEAFFADTLSTVLAPETDIATYRAKIAKKLKRDAESTFDPILFHKIESINSNIGSVSTQLRRGQLHNEMTYFRYDAILNKDAAPDSKDDGIHLVNITADESGLDTAIALMDSNSHACIIINNVPNKRLIRADVLLSSLSQMNPEQNIKDLTTIVDSQLRAIKSYEPEDFWSLANDSYTIEVDWDPGKKLGMMQVRLYRKDLPIRDVGVDFKSKCRLSNNISMKENNSLPMELSAQIASSLPELDEKIDTYIVSEALMQILS